MLLLSILTFFLTLFFLFIFYKFGGFKKYVDDHNKPEERKVLTSSGIILILILSFIYIIFLPQMKMYGIVGMLLIASFIGLYDDFHYIRKWYKVPILLVASIPIFTFYGIQMNDFWAPTILGFNFSYFYWFLIIPIIIAGFANGGNVIAGYDGMEVGIYTLMALLSLLIGIIENNWFVIFLSSILLSSLLAMLIFNWYPSRLILGNSGSFPISAFLGLIPLIGHFEIVLPIIFAPHLLEVYLQLKYTKKHKYDVFGDVDQNGIIHNRYGIKSIIHWLISWGNMTEKKITMAMLGIEAALCMIAFFVWYIWYVFV